MTLLLEYATFRGIGSLLEEIMFLQNVQVGHKPKQHLMIVHPYWERLISTMQTMMYDEPHADNQTTFIRENDLRGIKYSDNVNEITDHIVVSHRYWKTHIHDPLYREMRKRWKNSRR